MMDRVFLSDYVREVEIGVYSNEMGVRQRLRFNIEAEIAPFDGPPGADDMSAAVDYDRFWQAIDRLAEGDRLTLIETFADRLATILFESPRIQTLHIRIEKLDRLEGGARLGCQIERRR